MKCTRRSFLKLAGAGVLTLTLGQLGINIDDAMAYAGKLKIEGAKEVVTICPFCSVCCQVIAYVRDGKLVSTAGDPDHPVNEGALCAKWEEKDWDWTLNQIARRVKDARDKDMILKNGAGQTVNRLESIFMMVTSHASNEE